MLLKRKRYLITQLLHFFVKLDEILLMKQQETPPIPEVNPNPL